jgi:hypothetical protein
MGEASDQYPCEYWWACCSASKDIVRILVFGETTKRYQSLGETGSLATETVL